MGKKVKEYKSGDFIFAKVKGYPAWPARVQRMNGKKYFVYFYGTGETANLAPNMIFDYSENKDKFLTKTVKRRDFNNAVKQIEHDFINNVPLDQVIGQMVEPPAEGIDDTANDTANDTMDDSAIDTAADDTTADTTAPNTTQNDTAVEDSDDAGPLVIDEGKQQAKTRKSKAPEPVKTPKTPKTPRGKAKKDDKKEEVEEEKKDEKEELVSRSGRKIRPKRYLDEQTEDNATLPSPAPKKKRGASPPPEKEKESKEKDKEQSKEKSEGKERNVEYFNNVMQHELEDLKEPFQSVDTDKENILLAYLPSGQYVGIKVFQTRPAGDDPAPLQRQRQQAANAVALKTKLERGVIMPHSVAAQLVMDVILTDEEKGLLEKERETEEKKARIQFLKTEMKLIELDAKIKTCLCLEKADTELCLKLLDELMELEVKPLMLLKHPTCLETIKRMRAYVGNTPSWDLTEQEALSFSKQAHKIRKQADSLYRTMKELFTTPDGLSFWEFFSGRVLQFKKATANLDADQLLQMVHEPIELNEPSFLTMSAAIEAANEKEPAEEPEPTQKKKNTKSKKSASSTPAKAPVKRQNSRSKAQEENKDKQEENKDKEDKAPEEATNENKQSDKDTEAIKEIENTNNTDNENKQQDVDMEENVPENQEAEKVQENDKTAENQESDKSNKKEENEKTDKHEESDKEKQNDKNGEESSEPEKKESSKKKEVEKEKEKEKEKEDEPRAKRARGEKKTEAPPRSPAKRKVKA